MVKRGFVPLKNKSSPFPLKGKGIKGIGSQEMQRKATGALGEKYARDFLKKKGYRLLETNYRCPRGEIDIIARHKDSLVFIEVHTKTSLAFGSPEESISFTKRNHMRTTAFHYIQSHQGLPEEWSIGVVAVEMDRNGKLSRIELLENAVGEE
jgi:putative endonuclease